MNSLIKFFTLAIALSLPAAIAQAKTPDGWPFVDYNEAVRVAQQTGKPLFVYFGFPTCPYCEYANKHTFSSDALRKLYADHYVLGYFDIRGNPDDVIPLPGGEKISRAEAVKRLKAAPVPAWMFVGTDGRQILMRRGSRTPVEAFMQFDLYVASGAYKRGSFEDFLLQRGLSEAKAE